MEILNQSYQQVLKDELEGRRKINRRYSLRAFAKDLGMNPSRLSEIFNFKQGLSPKAAYEIGQKLGFSEDKTAIFCDMVAAMDSRSKKERELARQRLEEWKRRYDSRQKLDLEIFRVVSDWYHSAIMELTKMDGFKNDINWMAEQLDISPNTAQEAIDRLKKLNLLREVDGHLKMVHSELMTSNDVPNDGVKAFHSQILQKGIQALENQSVVDREFGNIVIVIDPQMIPELKERFRVFRNEIDEWIEAQKVPKNEVYVLGNHFYRLSKKQERKQTTLGTYSH